jgi:hypothetical protein
MDPSRPLPPLAALFTTDHYRVPSPGPEPAPEEGSSVDQWELPLDDARHYGLTRASGQIEIVPPAY